MDRSLTPEILDSLDPGDPAAQHSRRDLALINRLMGNEPWFRAQLQGVRRPAEPILELGAGGGEIGSALSKGGLAVDGLDLCPRPRGWPAGRLWHQADMRTFPGYGDYPIVMANLFLHHFSAPELLALGAKLDGSRVIVAVEPARRRRSQLLCAALAPLVGANHVTRHDARVSIAAGFLGDELPFALGLSTSRWRSTCEVSFFGAYRMVAVRRQLDSPAEPLRAAGILGPHPRPGVPHRTTIPVPRAGKPG